jgi:hypothetical protein
MLRVKTRKHHGADAAFCPSCERFIGASDSCPYCDTDSARPPILAHLRAIALLTALVGLTLLLVSARSSRIRNVDLSRISPTMNYARVRVSGTVARDAYVDRESEPPSYVSFTMADGSNQLRVVADGRTAADMVEGNLLPRKGDRVEAEGSLGVQAEGRIRLRLSRATDMIIERAPPSTNTVRRTKRPAMVPRPAPAP